MPRLYEYVGPAAIKVRVAGQPAGKRISSAAGLLIWTRQADGDGANVAATFVVAANGDLLLADRRSEHIACAAGGAVLSAGEMFFSVGSVGVVEVVDVSNQSTGYCPEPESWGDVATTLDRIGVVHPGRFTQEIVFRRCEKCGERNIVKDGWFSCGVCGADLPATWNF